MPSLRFRISVISEPTVAPDTPRELLRDDLADKPDFLFFVLHASYLLPKFPVVKPLQDRGFVS
jgi:hypothetical protein